MTEPRDVQLSTAQGRYVATATLPALAEVPHVITWAGRAFIRWGHAEYREATVYAARVRPADGEVRAGPSTGTGRG